MNKKTAEYMKEKVKQFELLENKINLLQGLKSDLLQSARDISMLIDNKITQLEREMEEL